MLNFKQFYIFKEKVNPNFQNIYTAFQFQRRVKEILDRKLDAPKTPTIDDFELIPIIGIFSIIIPIMSKNTSVSLGNYFDEFVKDQIQSGRYKNVSEVIREGLRLLENEEGKVKILRAAVQEGIDSGIAKNFDPKEHLKSLKAKK